MYRELAYRRLLDSPHHDLVVAANRAYLSAAVPDPAGGAGSRWVLTCLPGTVARGERRRLSAISMRWMETLVLFLPASPDHDASALHGLVNLRRVGLLAAYGSRRRAEQRLGLRLHDSTYRDPGPDQIQARGRADQLLAALGQEEFAAAARALAVDLMRYRTPYARFHNRYLTDAVLDPAGPGNPSMG